jgi:hypothetical protein
MTAADTIRLKVTSLHELLPTVPALMGYTPDNALVVVGFTPRLGPGGALPLDRLAPVDASRTGRQVGQRFAEGGVTRCLVARWEPAHRPGSDSLQDEAVTALADALENHVHVESIFEVYQGTYWPAGHPEQAGRLTDLADTAAVSTLAYAGYDLKPGPRTRLGVIEPASPDQQTQAKTAFNHWTQLLYGNHPAGQTNLDAAVSAWLQAAAGCQVDGQPVTPDEAGLIQAVASTAAGQDAIITAWHAGGPVCAQITDPQWQGRDCDLPLRQAAGMFPTRQRGNLLTLMAYRACCDGDGVLANRYLEQAEHCPPTRLRALLEAGLTRGVLPVHADPSAVTSTTDLAGPNAATPAAGGPGIGL